MNSMITEVVGSTYFVSEASAYQSIKEEKSFTESYQNRIAQISRVHKVREVSSLRTADEHTKKQEFFKTQVITNENGEQSIVMVSSHQRFKEINLRGTGIEETERIVNPIKVKAAYFKDE